MPTCYITSLTREIHFHVKNLVALDPLISNGHLFFFFEDLESHPVINHFLLNSISLKSGISVLVNPEGLLDGLGDINSKFVHTLKVAQLHCFNKP